MAGGYITTIIITPSSTVFTRSVFINAQAFVLVFQSRLQLQQSSSSSSNSTVSCDLDFTFHIPSHMAEENQDHMQVQNQVNIDAGRAEVTNVANVVEPPDHKTVKKTLNNSCSRMAGRRGCMDFVTISALDRSEARSDHFDHI